MVYIHVYDTNIELDLLIKPVNYLANRDSLFGGYA